MQKAYTILQLVLFISLVSLIQSSQSQIVFADTYSISGIVFRDVNMNGIRESTEQTLFNRQVTLTGTLLDGTPYGPVSVTTTSTGYSFPNLQAGTYVVNQPDTTNWGHTTPTSVTVILDSSVSQINFGKIQVGTIIASAYNDLNANGNLNSGETSPSGFNFLLSGTLLNGSAVATTKITSAPKSTFSNVYPGDYVLTSLDKGGWVRTTSNTVNVNMPSTGGTYNFNFGFYKLSRVTGTVYGDDNGNGKRGAIESGISGLPVTLQLSDASQIYETITSASGSYDFQNVPPGTYFLSIGISAPLVVTAPYNYPAAVIIGYTGTTTTIHFGIFDTSGDLLEGFGDITSISLEGMDIAPNGNIYMSDSAFDLVRIFDTSGNEIGLLGSAGELTNPGGIAIEDNGNIFVANNNDQIFKFDSNGVFLFSFGSEGNGPGELNSPRGLAIDSQGNLLVADGNNNRIEKFDSSGNYLETLISGGVTNGFVRLPFDVTVDQVGNIVVADTGNDRVQIFDPNGTWLRTVGSSGNGDAQLLRPRSAYVNSSGFVFVTDTYHNRIQIYDSNSNHVAHIGRLGADPDEFGNPSKITMVLGNLWIIDSANDRIQLIDTSGQYISEFRIRPSLMEPYFSIFNPSGNLLVSDGHNHKIITFDYSTGEVLSEFGSLGSLPGEFRGPRGILIDSAGDIFVADNYNNRLVRFDSNGNFISNYGSSGTANGQFAQPRGLVLDSTGRILVADTQNNRVQVFDGSLTHLSTFSSTLPYQISLDAFDNIYVAQQTEDRIQKYNPNGSPLVTFGTSGSGPGQFLLPRGIAVDVSGNIYVVDQGNNRIQKFDANFNYITTFGTPGKGPGEFLAPRTMIIDQDGNLVIADAGNQRIQVLDSNGNFIKQFTYNP